MGKRAAVWAVLLCFSLSACSARNVTRGMEEGEAYDAVISVKGSGETDSVSYEKALAAAQAQLDAIMELVGKSDEEAEKLLGGGKENRTSDGSFLVGRVYRALFFGREADIYSSYDEFGKVCLVFVELPEGSASDYVAAMEALLGDHKKPDEIDVEAEGESWQWKTDSCVLTLYEIDGSLSLDIVPAK